MRSRQDFPNSYSTHSSKKTGSRSPRFLIATSPSRRWISAKTESSCPCNPMLRCAPTRRPARSRSLPSMIASDRPSRRTFPPWWKPDSRPCSPVPCWDYSDRATCRSTCAGESPPTCSPRLTTRRSATDWRSPGSPPRPWASTHSPPRSRSNTRKSPILRLYWASRGSNEHRAKIRQSATSAQSHVRRRRLSVRRYWTYQAHGNSVGVFDDRVARAPERVVRFLQAAISGTGHVAEQIVDIRARGHAKSDDDAAAQVGSTLPAAIDALRSPLMRLIWSRIGLLMGIPYLAVVPSSIAFPAKQRRFQSSRNHFLCSFLQTILQCKFQRRSKAAGHCVSAATLWPIIKRTGIGRSGRRVRCLTSTGAPRESLLWIRKGPQRRDKPKRHLRKWDPPRPTRPRSSRLAIRHRLRPCRTTTTSSWSLLTQIPTLHLTLPKSCTA